VGEVKAAVGVGEAPVAVGVVASSPPPQAVTNAMLSKTSTMTSILKAGPPFPTSTSWSWV
jgi:hypothetical protein